MFSEIHAYNSIKAQVERQTPKGQTVIVEMGSFNPFKGTYEDVHIAEKGAAYVRDARKRPKVREFEGKSDSRSLPTKYRLNMPDGTQMQVVPSERESSSVELRPEDFHDSEPLDADVKYDYSDGRKSIT